MKSRIALISVASVAIVLVLALPSAHGRNVQQSFSETVSAPPPRFETNEPIEPITVPTNLDRRKVSLGRTLFHDTRLSHKQDVACATCHDLEEGGDDGMPLPRGARSGRSINTPTVFNVSLNFRLFWDGRAETLEQQIDGPLLNSAEMDVTWEQVIAKLSADPRYVERFAQIYPEGITPDTVRGALAEFERSLVTPDSRFDRYLRGDHSAISREELEGFELFKSYGCVACHQGVNVGGNVFQVLGVMGDYFKDRGIPITSADLGRYNVTGKEEDRHKFKVPSLRNIELTAPYFHDGSAATLEDAVRVMSRYQLGKVLRDEEVKKIVSFLRTLTGVYRRELQ